MKKCLILGINGFTGKHFQKFLKKKKLLDKYTFVGVDRQIDWEIEQIIYREEDLTSQKNIDRLIVNEKPNYIFNFIGAFQSSDFNELFQLNANFARILCDCLIKNNIPVEKVLLVGSAAEYGIPTSLPVDESANLNPVNNYGLAKVLQSDFFRFYFKNHKLPLVMARTFNIIGEGISKSLSIGSFIHQIKTLRDFDTIKVGNLSSKRDYLDISDVADAYWKLALLGEPGEIFNVCSGHSFKMDDILNTLIKASGKKIIVKIDDSFIKKNDIDDIYGDFSKLQRATGWIPHSDIFKSLERCIAGKDGTN